MAIRVYGLFQLATIFAYVSVAGILLLSILTLKNLDQRRAEFDAFRDFEINSIGKREPVQWCQPLRYLDGDIDDDVSRRQNQNGKLKEFRGNNLIALASFTGSGNTWLRYLLQQATGIYTGSVYDDSVLVETGFPAEHIFNSSVLIVKTHGWGPKCWIHYSKAILLVRDPEKAMIAEFNRQSSGHVGFAPLYLNT